MALQESETEQGSMVDLEEEREGNVESRRKKKQKKKKKEEGEEDMGSRVLGVLGVLRVWGLGTGEKKKMRGFGGAEWKESWGVNEETCVYFGVAVSVTVPFSSKESQMRCDGRRAAGLCINQVNLD